MKKRAMCNLATTWSLAYLMFLAPTQKSNAQANDNCEDADLITIANGGLEFGTFSSLPQAINMATVQTGEYFAYYPLLSDRSLWWRFTLPESRRTTLQLTTNGIGNNTDVGWTAYRVNSPTDCLPGYNEWQAAFFSPMQSVGASIVGCLPSGEYLVQVTANAGVGFGSLTLNLTLESCPTTGFSRVSNYPTTLFPVPCPLGTPLILTNTKPTDLCKLIDALGRERALITTPTAEGCAIGTDALEPGCYTILTKDGRSYRSILVH